MIGRLIANEGANAALVVALSGTIATLVAHGPGLASFGRALSRVMSNPVPKHVTSGHRDCPSTAAFARRAAA